MGRVPKMSADLWLSLCSHLGRRLSWLGALGAWVRLAHGGDMTETFIAKPQCQTLSLSVFSWASQRSQGGFSRLCGNSGS